MADAQVLEVQVLEVIGIVKDHHGARRNNPQPVLMPCGAGIMQGCGTPDSNS
jgi:hypothetical protein